MLAKRIIPCLDVTAGRVVKGVNFVDLARCRRPGRDRRPPTTEAGRRRADCFLDITATQRWPRLDRCRSSRRCALAAVCFIPLTVGGGVRSVADVRARCCNAGADKVSGQFGGRAPNRRSFATPRPSTGAQCIVVAIDAKRWRRRWRRCEGRRLARSAAGRGSAEQRGDDSASTGLGRLDAWRSAQHRHRRRRMGQTNGRRRCRRDPAHQHGPRRHARSASTSELTRAVERSP